jgi:hypothetical protein
MMAHPLEAKIAQVRGRAWRLLILHALGWTVAIIVTCGLVLGLVDYWIRFQDRGIRLMASAAMIGVCIWAAWRFWIRGLARSPSDVELARRVQRRFPALGDRLASAVEFLKQDEADATAGSAELRRAVIVDATTAAEDLDFLQVFDRKPTRRALAAAAVAGIGLLVLVGLDPAGARLALVRLARPFGNDSWPRLHHIEFRDPPTRLAAGQPFEVELMSDPGHRVPDDVRIYYRYDSPSSGSGEVETEPMHELAGVRVARKDAVTRPFWYRAGGGDDQSMEWIQLSVVEPPRVESLRVSIHPPAYSGLPVETTEKSIQALRGSRVELAGSSTKKLRGARVFQESGATIEATVSPDGHQFSLAADAPEPMEIDKSGAYWIELEDVEGLKGGDDERWDVRAVADSPPTVTFEQPAANLFVTPEAEISIKVAAKDDLSIRDMFLHYSRSDRTDVEAFTVRLYRGPDRAAALAAGALTAGQLGESRVVEHSWSLTELGAKSGTRITFWGNVTDYVPQEGKSTVRQLTLITKAELEDRLAQRQSLILGELQRVLKLEQEARAGIQSLEIQAEQVGRLTTDDIDSAQAAELNQRQVARTLTSSSEGIPAQVADFLSELASNRIDSPDVERHMHSILQELERLGQQHLPTIERELTSAIKAAQTAAAGDAAAAKAADPLVKQSLSTAGSNQDQVIASLEGMLSELGQWDNYRRFAREVAQLEREQQEVTRSTAAIGEKTLGRDLKDLDAQQQANLKKLASSQADLSRRLEKTQQQMSEMTRSLKQDDPLSAATISDGLHHAQQQAISGQMRQAASQLENNQLGQASQQQAKIARDLEELSAILSNRREQELSRLVKQLREAEKDLDRMRAKQAGLRKQIASTAAQDESAQKKRQLERLAREEKQLQEDVSRLARRLERLQAEAAGRAAAGAAGKLGQAGSMGQQGDADGAGQQAEKAEKDLEDAQQQLAERRKAAEEDLAREQMARLADSLKSLHERQKKLIAETQRLDKLRVAEGRLTRAQIGSLQELTRGQKSLETETSGVAEKLSATEIIALALERAAGHMDRATGMLSQQRTDAPTQQAQENARLKLSQLLTAFENKSKPGKGQGGEAAGGGGGKAPRQDGNYVLAQLKLIKVLQEDLNGRFNTVAGSDAAGASDELAQIAAEQGKLADLAARLSQPTEPRPEDDPDKLPDVRRDNTPVEDPTKLLLDEESF